MSESKQTPKLDLQEIAHVAEATGAEDVNAHLALGWIIIGMSSTQHSEHGFLLTYHLGWQESLGEPKNPPATGWKKLFAEAKEREGMQSGDKGEPPF